jgi:hypothetical protein
VGRKSTCAMSCGGKAVAGSKLVVPGVDVTATAVDGTLLGETGKADAGLRSEPTDRMEDEGSALSTFLFRSSTTPLLAGESSRRRRPNVHPTLAKPTMLAVAAT